MRRGIKHSSQCFAKFPNASKFVQNTSRHVVISNLFRVFGNVVKQSLPCMIYYFLIKYVQYYVILSFAFLPTIVTKLSRNSTTLTSFSKLCFFIPSGTKVSHTVPSTRKVIFTFINKERGLCSYLRATNADREKPNGLRQDLIGIKSILITIPV